MKKAALVIVSLLLISTASDAQYKINKSKYDSHNYSYQPGDPYNLASAGFASMIIPGLGQIMAGEKRRGQGFIGGYAGSCVVTFVGLVIIINSPSEGRYYNEERERMGKGIFFTGLICATATWIWSISDAIEVAKVNNLAYRDKNKTSCNLLIKPYLRTSKFEDSEINQGGLIISITF